MTLWTQWTSLRLTSEGLVSTMPSMQQPLLTSAEVAKILRVSRCSAYVIMKRGELPVVHVGNVVRVRPKIWNDISITMRRGAISRFSQSVMGIKFAYGLQSANGRWHINNRIAQCS